MIDKLSKTLAVLKEMSIKNVAMFFLLCVIGLSSFYTYKKIENIEFIVESQHETTREKYLREFGLQDLQETLLIRDILIETRILLGANQASIWGYHNGIEVGPFPFRKISLIDESVGSGDASIAKKYQEMPLNLFIDVTLDLWENNRQPLIVHLEDAKEKYPNTYYEMLNNNYRYSFMYPIYVDDYNPPVGVFVLNLGADSYEKVFKKDKLQTQFEETALNQAKRVELIFNRQYRKLLQNEKR